jgi:hypothetical protein
VVVVAVVDAVVGVVLVGVAVVVVSVVVLVVVEPVWSPQTQVAGAEVVVAAVAVAVDAVVVAVEVVVVGRSRVGRATPTSGVLPARGQQGVRETGAPIPGRAGIGVDGDGANGLAGARWWMRTIGLAPTLSRTPNAGRIRGPKALAAVGGTPLAVVVCGKRRMALRRGL